MSTFDPSNFSRHLLTEMLFFDAEYGALGNVSLVDTSDTPRERYVAAFLPEEGAFVIEEATEWEKDYNPAEDDEIGYALAVDAEEYGLYDTPEAAAEELLSLAGQFNLLPSLTLLFEEEEL